MQFRRVRVGIATSEAELSSFFGAIVDGKWQGLNAIAEQAIYDFVRAPKGTGIRNPRRERMYGLGGQGYGEVFWKRERLYYAIYVDPDDDDLGIAWTARSKRSVGSYIELGEVYSSQSGEANDEFNKFIAHCMECAKKHFSKHVDKKAIVASEVVASKSLEEILKGTSIQKVPPFKLAIIPGECIEILKLFSNKEVRDVVVNISISKTVRHDDLERSLQEIESGVRVEHLVDKGVVRATRMVECKRHNRAILKSVGDEFFGHAIARSLECPHCGSKLDDEREVVAYALSALADDMNRANKWLTLLTTMKLIEIGVPINAIWWNLEEGGGEIDILVYLNEQIWVFEVKDKEFGAGDAYPFNHRRGRYNATKSIVITTEKVSSDAKEAFKEAVGQQSGRLYSSDRGLPEPVYIEGLENLEQSLRELVRMASYELAKRLLFPLEQTSGYRFSDLIMGKDVQLTLVEEQERQKKIQNETATKASRETVVESGGNV